MYFVEKKMQAALNEFRYLSIILIQTRSKNTRVNHAKVIKNLK